MKDLKQFHSTNFDFDTFKQEAISVQPIVADIELSKLQLCKERTIKYNGNFLPLSDSAYNSFLKNIIGVDTSFIEKFKNVTDSKMEENLLSTMQSKIMTGGQKTVKVVGTNDSRIVNFIKSDQTFLTNEMLFSAFELIMNRYPTLELKDAYLDPNNGNVNLNIRAPQEINLGHANESFQNGLSFENNYMNGTNMFMNVLRMICTNGMIGFDKMNIGAEGEDLKHLIKKIDALAEKNFMPSTFLAKFEEKNNYKASIAEVERVQEIMIASSNLQKENIGQFLPMDQIYADYKAKGIFVENLSTAQKKNCPVKFLSGWDLLNVLTDFGSHDYGVKTNYADVQKQSARLMLKNSDTANLVLY